MMKSAEQSHFQFNPLTRIVAGARRAGLYDLASGDVYVFDGRLAEVLSRPERMTLADMAEQASTRGLSKRELFEVIEQMLSLGLGELTPKPVHRDQFKDLYDPEGYKKSEIARLDKTSIQLTNACDLNCLFCADPDVNPICFPCRKETRLTTHLARETVVEVLEDARLLNCPCIRLSGGDPLLWNGDLPSLLELADGMGFASLEVYTPAIRVSSDLQRRLAPLKSLTWIVPFFAASAKDADPVSGKTGAFAESMKNVVDLKSAGARVVVLLPILEVNRSMLDETVALFHGLSIPFMVYAGLNLDIQRRQTAAPQDNSAVLPNGFQKKDMMKIWRNMHWNPCWSFSAAVNSNGEIKPCFYSSQVLGVTPGQSSLRDVLRGQGLEELWRISKDKIDTCCQCEFRYACQDCRVAAERIGGDLYAKYPLCSYDPFKSTWKRSDIHPRIAIRDF